MPRSYECRLSAIEAKVRALAQGIDDGTGEDLPDWARQSIEAHCTGESATVEYWAAVVRELSKIEGAELSEADIASAAVEMSATARAGCIAQLGRDWAEQHGVEARAGVSG